MSNLLDAVHQAPISFVKDTDLFNVNFATVDYSAVTVALSQALIVPYMLAPVFAETIVGLEQGNASGFLAAFPPLTANLFTCNSGLPMPFSLGGLDVMTAIQCGDRLVLEPSSLQASRPIFNEMIATSPSFGPVLFAQTAGPCSYVFNAIPCDRKAHVSLGLGRLGQMTFSMPRSFRIRASLSCSLATRLVSQLGNPRLI